MDLGKDEIGSHTGSTLPAYMASDLAPNLEPLLSPASELDPGTPNKDAEGAVILRPLAPHLLSLLPLSASQQTAQGSGLACASGKCPRCNEKWFLEMGQESAATLLLVTGVVLTDRIGPLLEESGPASKCSHTAPVLGLNSAPSPPPPERVYFRTGFLLTKRHSSKGQKAQLNISHVVIH